MTVEGNHDFLTLLRLEKRRQYQIFEKKKIKEYVSIFLLLNWSLFSKN